MVVSLDREKELVLRLKQGERSAFDELVELYRNRGFAICYNLVTNLEDAKDVLQEAFIKVYLNIKGFEEKSRLSTWFYRIAVNCSLDFLRKRKKTEKLFTPAIVEEEDKEQEIPDSRFEPSKIIIKEELAKNLDNCINELPEKQRLCFILKHQDGLANQEIAKVLGCSLSTVKVHIFRAVRNLQDKLLFYLK